MTTLHKKTMTTKITGLWGFLHLRAAQQFKSPKINTFWKVLTKFPGRGLQKPDNSSSGTLFSRNYDSFAKHCVDNRCAHLKALKKLVSFGTFRLIPYLHKNWSLSTLNLPVQDLNSKSGFFGKCKNWGFQFQKWKVTCEKILQFSTFCKFLNWSW